MLSYLGFEAFDAPNMYQFSYAYDYATGGQDIYDAYADGFSVDYGSDMFFRGSMDRLPQSIHHSNTHSHSQELESHSESNIADYGDDADDIMTLWASYELDKLLLAVEFASDDKNAGVPWNCC